MSKILNISTLAVGEKYYKYLELLLFSINENYESGNVINIFITHGINLKIDVHKFPNINIKFRELSQESKKYFGRGTFPFFLKNEAVKFALENHNDGDFFIHVDCDAFYGKNPLDFVEKIKEFDDSSGIFVFKNSGYSYTTSRKLRDKNKTLLSDTLIHPNLYWITNNPKTAIWFWEGYMYFNILKKDIENFTLSWNSARDIILKNKLSFRPDSNEILYSCIKSNININLINEPIKRLKYFNFLDKKTFNELIDDGIDISEIYNILMRNPKCNPESIKINRTHDYNGFVYSGSINSYNSFKQMIDKHRPEYIIEFGASSGGRTLWLREVSDKIDKTIKIKSFYSSPPNHFLDHLSKYNSQQIEYHVGDILDVVLNDLLEIVKNNKVLILCDGKTKKEAFNVISNHIKTGDVILAHDYCKDYNDFVCNVYGKIWNWFEICDSDIKDACERNNLVDYMEDEMKQAAWVSKIKL